jgi:predicted acyl esterase
MSNKSVELRFWEGMTPEEGGYPGFNPRTEIKAGMLCHYDVAVPMRDGKRIFVDIFRPEQPGTYPALIAWSPYGKHGRTKYAWFHTCGVCDSDLSDQCIFEAPDPAYWCPNGYVIINVDSRGAWNSEGDLTFMTEQEGEDGYDLIEWAAAQDWCNGKVGLTGVSYLAWSQWRIAALNPPHLGAIIPWEGVSDFYREFAYHGGIPETYFVPGLKTFMSFTTTRVEDIATQSAEHHLLDDYWLSKNADLSQIRVPAFVVASWTDQGLHTRGTIEGFRRIASADKWLLIHGRKKWQFFYEQVDMQRQFFDKFLKGLKTEVDYWPKVKLEVRERYYWGNFRAENEWPLARTQYTQLFLDPVGKTMTRSPVGEVGQVRYRVDDFTDKTQRAQFTVTFDEPTELTGYMKLKLWAQAEGSDDMDLFVALEKIDRTGRLVRFPFFSSHEDGPVALGWLRVSHRELDQSRSTAYQPVHPHTREEKLGRGEIVPVEIEILPSGTRFEPGEQLRVVVQGSDIYYYPGGWPTNAHDGRTVNRGEHVIYAGGQYDSHLLVPVVPTR